MNEGTYGSRRAGFFSGIGPEDDSGGIGQAACFDCRCTRSAQGKVAEKVESGPLGRDVFSYEYDAAGRLAQVRKNGLLNEYYLYDEDGRRVQDFRAWAGERRALTYYYDGALIQAGNVTMEWTKQGQLAAVEREGRRSMFRYGNDTRLDRAALADGTDVRYDYGEGLMPERVTANGAAVAEYQWRDMLSLVRYRDPVNALTLDFTYGEGRVPALVELSGAPEAVCRATGLRERRVTLHVYADQVDSIRVLALPDGRPVKCVEYDSFGNLVADTRPDWRFPLGFACGLNDPFTGFTRFGYRDYDPMVGRFTAQDPLGDTGGDHDLWEYCVDDPVSQNDPSGLFPPLLLFGLGMLGAGGLGLGGAYAAAKVADGANKPKYGRTPQSAVSAMNRVAPYVGATMAAGAAPGVLALGGPPTAGALVQGGRAAAGAMAQGGRAAAGALAQGGRAAASAYTHAGQRAGAALASSQAGQYLGSAARFAEGALVPTYLPPGTPAGMLGVASSSVVNVSAKALDERFKK